MNSSFNNPHTSKKNKHLFHDSFNTKLTQRDEFSTTLNKEKAYQPYFITENISSEIQPEKNIKLNMNFNINPVTDSKNDRGLMNSFDHLKKSIKKFDYNYNLINNNYLN